jgi:hypothetical protein
MVFFVFSRGIQICNWFLLIPHRKWKTKKRRFESKNAKLRYRQNWDKPAKGKASECQEKMNGEEKYLNRSLNTTIWACFSPGRRGSSQVRFLHLFAWKMKGSCSWNSDEGVLMDKLWAWGEIVRFGIFWKMKKNGIVFCSLLLRRFQWFLALT